MKHSCFWINRRNDPYHLEEIEQVGVNWILHNRLLANKEWVKDGEAAYIGEVISDYKIIISFCPYCGEMLNHTDPPRQTGFHKKLLTRPEYNPRHPDTFVYCAGMDAINSEANEKWFINKDPDGIWVLDKYVPATRKMVEMGKADSIGELCFSGGFDILFCPFSGELLDEERTQQSATHNKDKKIT